VVYVFNPYLSLDDSWNLHHIYNSLSHNHSAINILKKNPELIDWGALSRNINAIELLKENQSKINWGQLSFNKNAIKILESNQERIYWNYISLNPNIFEIDYYLIKKRIEPFVEELMMVCFHPSRLDYYIEKYNYDIGDDTYIND